MSNVPEGVRVRTNDYPTSDGKPMAETEHHRDLMMDLIRTLQAYYADEPRVHVTGNLLLFYEEGNRRKHVAPDVFVVKGVPKHPRLNYLLWEEGKSPCVVIEITSKTTRREDLTTKRELYQGTLKVREYFLFDPFGDYLDPPLQGFRLRKGEYRPVRPLRGRLPSRELSLHLERVDQELRLFDPRDDALLPTPSEGSERNARRADEAELRAEVAEERASAADEEITRLRQMLAELQVREPGSE